MCSYVTWFEKRCELIESPQATAEQFRSTGMWGLGGVGRSVKRENIGREGDKVEV